MRKRRAPSTGRPRQAGERYACGKLKPPPPNEKVVAERRVLVGEGGDITRASHPLDLAFARGWITERQHRAGTWFARLYRKARLGAPDGSGQVKIGELQDDSERYSQMGDAAIAAAFDRVFDQVEGPDIDLEAAGAGAAWRRLNAVMAPAEQAEVFLVCVRASWPQWIVQRATGRYGTRWEDRRTLLVRGLDAMGGARVRADPVATGRVWSVAAAKPAARGPEERTQYVTPDGRLLFEVVKKTLRRGGSARSENPVSREAAKAQ